MNEKNEKKRKINRHTHLRPVGTDWFMAPEVRACKLHNLRCSEMCSALDWYSLGATLYYLLLRGEEEMGRAWVVHMRALTFPSYFTHNERSLLKMLLADDPRCRDFDLNVDILKMHPFFTSQNEQVNNGCVKEKALTSAFSILLLINFVLSLYFSASFLVHLCPFSSPFPYHTPLSSFPLLLSPPSSSSFHSVAADMLLSALSHTVLVDIVVLAVQGPNSSSIKEYDSVRFSDYVSRVLLASQASLSVVILSLYYTQAVKEMSWNGKRDLTPGSLHPASSSSLSLSLCCYRLFLTSLILASKFLEDHTYTNASWGKIGHLHTEEVNRLERELLHALGFRLYMGAADFEQWAAYWLSVERKEFAIKDSECK